MKTSHVERGGKSSRVCLRAIGLKSRVFFQPVVKAQHELVVRGTGRNGQADGMKGLKDSAARSAGRDELSKAGRDGEGIREFRKAGTDHPNARLVGVCVGEHPEDPSPAGRTTGKSVHMEEVVFLVQGQVAALFFQRPKTRIVDLELSGIGSKQAGDESAVPARSSAA